MKLKLSLVAYLLFFASLTFAQHAVTSANWEILNTYSYQMQNNKSVVIYPPALKAIDNKVIELSGYLIPIKVGREHKEFLLSVLPVEQCAFCGSGKYPPMVLVKMMQPVPYSEHIIFVKGKFQLNDLGNTQHEYAMINAVIAPQKK
ncbi:hypothetical protein KHS38_21900 [Mucilaginibacter sp. Bleaf8]|uniref:hypothetical protein n=1 Tax=Mucilaginibacter sp. Bleaf8 TaxID=2834430 RepID=UPI001BCB95FB|nr:hypothetical protein [Mucilaginibacter sp. Bleaf8]MBS7567074.1 hypothetical protein [Mucilaginibacter sp. Bleaf8]